MNSESRLCVVVGLDLTPTEALAFGQAARVARTVPGAEIHLVHVLGGRDATEARRRDLVERLRVYANEEGRALGGLGGVTIGIHVRAGDPAREIAQLASDLGASLVVLGARHRPHLRSWVIGSTAQHLLASAPCPVLVAGPKRDPEKHEPAIEPPCPDCLRVRAARNGTAFWCERHRHHVKPAHTFSYQRELPLATHDSSVIPTGIDM